MATELLYEKALRKACEHIMQYLAAPMPEDVSRYMDRFVSEVDAEQKAAAAILENAEPVRVGNGKPDRPRPEWIRGKCLKCGDDLVSNCYYVGGRGHLICWECWGSLAGKPTCDYRHVL